MFRLLTVCFVLSFLVIFRGTVVAADMPPVGFHLLEPQELDLALTYRPNKDSPLYITVPMSVYDRRYDVWNDFFITAQKNNVIPIVRWITKFDNGFWDVPTRKDIVEATKFLSQLDWSGDRIIVLFNEPNHAAEWGGTVDPAGYAATSLFAARWLKTETAHYVVLPAGLDADAPTNGTMMDSFMFMSKMYQVQPDLFDIIDGWTSHSYPNPGFSASAFGSGKNSVRGFDAEIKRLKQLTGKTFDVYITETGWRSNKQTSGRLLGYYREMVQKVWMDSRIKAVTLFVFKSIEGPFEEFSFLDSDNRPTAQLRALQRALDGK